MDPTFFIQNFQTHTYKHLFCRITSNQIEFFKKIKHAKCQAHQMTDQIGSNPELGLRNKKNKRFIFTEELDPITPETFTEKSHRHH